jgi:cellulose synthase/poly-beta-1,6-N-acetylglucosamine synthase-like glycosyltransferase
MIEITYWITVSCVALTLYVYLGYPALLYLITRFYKKPHSITEGYSDPVTLIISCYNEHDVIEEKIANSLAIDYPSDLFEIIFVSDGSDDGTDEAIKRHSDPRIKLIRQEGRLGKTSALNLAVPQALGKFIVFSDANAMYQPNAVKKLLRNFGSSDVGYVVGAAIYTDGDTSSAAESENSYWEYELAIKKMESDLSSVVGGDGAIYAIRKDLFQTLDVADINDFVNPLQIIKQGYRGIFDPEARCLEETANNFRKEAKRKERIVNRSFRGLMKERAVLNPFKFGIFSFEVVSHKLLRWLIPFFLLGIAVGSVILSFHGDRLFQLLYVLETLFLGLAVIGYLKQNQTTISPIFFYPYYFLMVNFYSMVGVIKALSGNIQITWSSPRTTVQENHISIKEWFVAVMLIVLPIVLFASFIQ